MSQNVTYEMKKGMFMYKLARDIFLFACAAALVTFSFLEIPSRLLPVLSGPNVDNLGPDSWATCSNLWYFLVREHERTGFFCLLP